MAYLDDLIAARDRIAAELAAGDIAPAYSIDGQAVDWTAYRRALLEELKEYTELIKEAGGPVEEWTYVVPTGENRP